MYKANSGERKKERKIDIERDREKRYMGYRDRPPLLLFLSPTSIQRMNGLVCGVETKVLNISTRTLLEWK